MIRVLAPLRAGRWLPALLMCLAMGGCDDDGGDTADSAPTADMGPDGEDRGPGPETDAEPADLGPLPSLEAVPGDLTYIAYESGGGRIYSVQADGDLRRPITRDPAPWTDHAVGPDPRFIAALRHTAALADGRPDPGAPAEVWIIDVREQRSYPLSPPGCDAAIGGVGWQNDALVMFAAACDGAPSQAWLYPFDDESRDAGLLLQATLGEGGAVRDVFPIVNTSFFTFTRSSQACGGGSCVDKPAVFLGDYELGIACRVTDGDPEMTDTSTVDGGEPILGDHDPAFTRDLGAIVFSRNVAGKPAGPGGHFDLWRVQVDPAAFGGRPVEICGQNAVNLSGDTVDERYLTADGGEAVGHERLPQPAAGSRAPAGGLMWVGQTFGPAGPTSAIWIQSLDGARRAVTSPSGRADHPRWIIDDYMLTGER